MRRIKNYKKFAFIERYKKMTFFEVPPLFPFKLVNCDEEKVWYKSDNNPTVAKLWNIPIYDDCATLSNNQYFANDTEIIVDYLCGYTTMIKKADNNIKYLTTELVKWKKKRKEIARILKKEFNYDINNLN